MNLQEKAQTCLHALQKQHKTVSFAESCTGGLLAKTLTDFSGASVVFECGIVSYSGQIKHKVLGVSNQILEQFGEVSAQTAEAMARGVAALSGADIGVGVTGIAGPTGATADKKVGLIYAALFYRERIYPYKLELYEETMSREQRREYTAAFIFEKISSILQ